MSVIHSLRISLRSLLRAPLFSLTVVLVLGIGIGANVLIFDVVDVVLFEPLPFEDGDALVQVWERDQRRERGPLSLHNIVDLDDGARTLDGVAAYGYQSFTMSREEGAMRVSGLGVTTNFFEVLRVRPVAGRGFLDDEGVRGSSLVAVVSTGFWRSHFGDGVAISGRRITLNGRSFEIVGVAPDTAGFGTVDVWVPLEMNLDESKRGNHYLFGIARIGSSSSLDAARDEVEAIGRRLAERYRSTNEDRSFRLVPLREEWYGEFETPLYVLFATVAIVLLVAALNAAGLMLARTSARRHEVAIRSALGAGRRHLIAQFMAEGSILAGAAGVSGGIAALWGASLVATELPRTIGSEPGVDVSVVLFAVAVTIVTALVFSLAPLVHTSRSEVMSSLRTGGTQSVSRLRTRGRGSFVVLQFSLAVVLLVAATLLARSLRDLSRFDPGFEPSGTVTMRLALGEDRFDDPQEIIRVQRRILDEINAIGSVASVGIVSDLPFSGSRSTSTFRLATEEDYETADRRQATDGYFESMGMRIIEGRSIEAEDDLTRPRVAVVNDEMARQLWPEESPIGKRIVIGSPGEIEIEGEPVEREVVGVVGSIVHDRLGARPAMEIYLSAAQLPSRRMFVVVRSDETLTNLVPALRKAVRQADPAVAVYGFQSMTDRLYRSLRRNRVVASVVASFSVLALLLSVIGLYGLVSFVVSQRTREFGVRRALGASAGSIVWRVVKEGMLLAGAGTIAGIVASLFLMRFLRGLLFGVSPGDPATMAAVAFLLAVVTAAACAVPAFRAASVEVVRALREE